MKKILFIITTVFFLNHISAQYAKSFKFDKIVHDFGQLKEESNRVYHLFYYENTSTVPMFIRKVETSCGCTTPEYSRDTIKPGEKGYIKAIYETLGKSGPFEKYLYVYNNVDENFQTLTITGSVIPMPRKKFDDKVYTINYSNLNFSEYVVNINPILNNEIKTKEIKIFNYNGYPIKILALGPLPSYINVIINDSTMESEDSIKIIVEVDGTKITQVGDRQQRIELITDDNIQSSKFLYVITKMKEDFSTLTKKQLKNAPKVTMLTSNNIDMGTHRVGSKFSDTIKIKNVGKEELILKRIVPNCSCITFKADKNKLKKGEVATIIFTYDSINQDAANHKKYVTVYTNDPTNSVINLSFIAKLIF